jgi:hypothetical protein
VQTACGYLHREGFQEIQSQSDIRIDPTISAVRDDVLYGITVRTSRKGPDIASRPGNYRDLAASFLERGATAGFIGLKIASKNDFFDPRLTHLTRLIYRGDPLVSSTPKLEPLDPEALQ